MPLAPKCPLKWLTGLSCPACGIQRALHALLHGDIVGAMRFNYYLAFAIPYASAFVVHQYALRGNMRQRVGRFLYSRPVLLSYVVTFIAWFALRNIFLI